jgi:S1-C subfamily serine protease
VNSLGAVIGINTAKIPQGEGVGFAININVAREVADRLISLGPQPAPGFLGIAGDDISQGLAAALGLPVSYGIGVTYVGPGTPAEAAGLTTADVIVQMDGTPITGGQALTQFLRQHAAGSNVRIFTWRSSASGWVPISLDAVLGERPGG